MSVFSTYVCKGLHNWECDKMHNCKLIMESKVELIDDNPIGVGILRT